MRHAALGDVLDDGAVVARVRGSVEVERGEAIDERWASECTGGGPVDNALV